MINEDLSVPEQKVTYTVRDVLELIPEFAGTDVCEYIHFQEGCMEALELIGPENERTLLKFLKTKLKGGALARFSLHVARYDRLVRFLKAVKNEYGYTETHDGDFWLAQMAALKQKKGEPVREYGKRLVQKPGREVSKACPRAQFFWLCCIDCPGEKKPAEKFQV